jgi:L-iditol 2-dehydrogenase
MRGVRFLGDRRAVVEAFPDPDPDLGEVVVEIRAAGLCGSDLHHYRAPADSADVPRVIVGHEACGVVISVGDGVDESLLGSRVVVNHHYGCGTCLRCRAGSPKHCVGTHGTYGFSDDGADAEVMVARASALAPMPDALGFEEGALVACGTGTAFAALARLQLTGGSVIAIFGQGPVGLGATLLASTMGAHVIAVDVVDERLELAGANGAHDVVDGRRGDAASAVLALTSGLGADLTLECSGTRKGRSGAVGSARIGGRVCFVGVGAPTELDVSEGIIGKELTCYGSWTFTSAGLRDCMAFISEREVPLADLITHRFPLEQAEEAFSVFDGGRTGKCVLTP